MSFYAAPLVVLLQAAPASTPARTQPDHLILGIRDLDEGIRQFEEQTGVRPVIGGKHPGRGTQNALVSLGPGLYIEIMAPTDGAPVAGESPQLAMVRGVERLTPVGWAVSVADVADARGRLARAGFTVSEPMPGSRKRPDGTTLDWTTFGVTRPQIPGVPFFIRWGDSARHPSADSPTGCRLDRITVRSPSSADVTRVLDAVGLTVAVEDAPQAGLSFTLQCPKGAVTFGGAS
jgi:hypothetical protein